MARMQRLFCTGYLKKKDKKKEEKKREISGYLSFYCCDTDTCNLSV